MKTETITKAMTIQEFLDKIKYRNAQFVKNGPYQKFVDEHNKQLESDLSQLINDEIERRINENEWELGSVMKDYIKSKLIK